MKHPRISLLFALSLSLAVGVEAFSSSHSPTLPASGPPSESPLVALDPGRSQLWVAQRGALEVYDTTGVRLARLVTPAIRVARALEYDAAGDQVTVATDTGVLHFALHAQFGSDGYASRVIRREP